MTRSLELREICEVITDGTHYTPPDIGTGVPFLTVKDIDSRGTLDFEGCSKISADEYQRAVSGGSAPSLNDVLFSKDGTVGKVSVVRERREFTVLSSIAILRPSLSVVDPDYLGHALRSPMALDQAFRKKTGSAIRRIILSDLRSIRIPVPPLPEQRRIAAILDKADALRAKRREAIAKLDQLLQSVFLDMFGDPVTNPKGWVTEPLGMHTSKIGSGATPKGGESAYKDEGTALIRSMNVRDGRFLAKDLAYIDVEQARKLNNVVVEEDDVLLNITGASVARVCRAPGFVLPARVNQHVAIIRCTRSVSPTYIETVLLAMKQSLLQVAGAGATREAITKQQIESFVIPIPEPTVQERFAGIAGRIETQSRNAERELRRLDDLVVSLQHCLFKAVG